MFHRNGFAVLMVLVFVGPSLAQDKETDARLESLSKMLQKSLVDDAPNTFEQKMPGWGRTIPIPDRLLFPRLRKTVKKGDKMELPHGAWIRTKVKLDDPNKDVRIKVTEMKMVGAGKMKLKVQAVVDSLVEREQQQWQKGILLLVVISEAKTQVIADVECEAKFGLNTKKFPPAFEVNAEAKDVRLTLEKFEMLRIAPFVQGEKAKAIGDQMKVIVEGLVKAYEPDVKEAVNEAIAKSLKNGKGLLSPSSLLKLPPKN